MVALSALVLDGVVDGSVSAVPGPAETGAGAGRHRALRVSLVVALDAVHAIVGGHQKC